MVDFEHLFVCIGIVTTKMIPTLNVFVRTSNYTTANSIKRKNLNNKDLK